MFTYHVYCADIFHDNKQISRYSPDGRMHKMTSGTEFNFQYTGTTLFWVYHRQNIENTNSFDTLLELNANLKLKYRIM